MKPINGGQSALKQLGCDAALDFNPKLHEHFQVARAARLKPSEEGHQHEGNRSFANLENSKGTVGMGIEHNRKTGSVHSHVATLNGEVMYPRMSHAGHVRNALKEADENKYK
jgi:hypothetical protein